MGVVTSKTQLARQHETIGEAGFHRSWYPLCLSAELAAGNAIGRDFLGTRVVAWRDASGKPVVQSAWCPHLGADLSVGQVVEGRLRCAYHHWSFDGSGACAHIAAGDKIPSAARIFTYPVEETWGLVWAFNGDTPDFEVPRMPGASPETIDHEAQTRGERPWDSWVAVSNGVDFQHLRTLHGLSVDSMPDEVAVDAGGIEFRVESPYHLQHGRITGTNTFAQHLRFSGQDMFQMFTSAPIAPGRSRGFFVVGVPKGEGQRLPEVAAMVDRLSAEDAPVLSTMRFRRGLLTASDRHLARYFKYVEEFPTFLPPE
ncbi:MAG TPA: Rieske (2Fe-2S) protein [Reyranella sp.]|jgi:phenylpropionate dioxygenase-like ring-hydroxylating dioxygenase large terminal subunit|nr:Rieske (2Fe-2S) protein [Reyranella sp.]